MKIPSLVADTFVKYKPGILSWFSGTQYFNEDSFTTRLRRYQILAFVIFFACSFFNFLGNLNYSYIVTATACVVLIIIRYLIDDNKIQTSYILMLLCFNIALILLVYIEGTYSGVFLFFFPCIASFAFLMDQDSNKNMQLTYSICISSFLISVLISPEHSTIQKVSEAAYRQNFFFNVFISFFITGWMSYSLAKENSRRQNILKSKEVFLDTIFNSSLHAEIIVEADSGFITNGNLNAGSLFAVENVNFLLNKHACELFEDKGNDIYKTMCEPDGNWVGELTCIRMDGTRFPASSSVVSFENDSKKYKKLTITDITEKNQILHELQIEKNKAEEMAAIKSQFLSHMSHELRTPLNGIIGATNLMLEESFLPGQAEKLNVLKISSEHMLSLINDVLDLSKLDADKIKLEKIPVDLPKFISSVTSPFIQQFKNKGLEFEVDLDPDIKHSLLTDPTRLNQVLTNLLSNALKFTSNGSVTLTVKGISLKSDTNVIDFSISDTGIGISEDKRNTIFEQFSQADVRTTRKYGGTGLGLTISQKLVRLMGSELKVESRYNKGSKFYFTLILPVYYSKSRALSNNKKLENNRQLKGLTVLIAEDNPINMMIAAKFLDKWGVSYKKAKNGLEAISVFSQYNLDMILMDLDMPEMDGYEALQAIRKINSGIPAIAFTAAVFENMKDKLVSCGFNDYIQKPFRPEELHSKLLTLYRGLN